METQYPPPSFSPPPRQDSYAAPQSQPRHSRPAPSSRPSGGRKKGNGKRAVSVSMHRKWHAMSSLEAIENNSKKWVATLNSPGIIKTYIAGMTTLTITFAAITYILDIRPSAIFGWHIAGTLAESLDWLSPGMIAGMVVLLSILPNLLEFAAGGLAAHGNWMAAASITASLLFDLITDTPAAYQLGKATVVFFFPALAGTGFKVMSGIVTFPILLFNSFGSEVLLFTFGMTTILLVKRLFALKRRTHY